MPSFKVHIAASSLAGVAVASLGVTWQGWSPPVAVLAGLAGFVGGMVPDLDSDSSSALRLIGVLVSVILAVAAVHMLSAMKTSPLETALGGAGLLLVFNTAGVSAFKALTRHRGMWHSLPTAVAYGAALAAVFAPLGRTAALGVAVVGVCGVASHLVLDAVFGLTLNPLKLRSDSRGAGILAWAVMIALGVLAARNMGWTPWGR